MGADLSVDRQRLGSAEKDPHAGRGYQTRNEEALFQWSFPSRPRSVLSCQSYPADSQSPRTRKLRRRKHCERGKRRTRLLTNTQIRDNFPANFRYFSEKPWADCGVSRPSDRWRVMTCGLRQAAYCRICYLVGHDRLYVYAARSYCSNHLSVPETFVSISSQKADFSGRIYLVLISPSE